MQEEEMDELENFPNDVNLSDVIPRLSEYSMENLCNIIICDRYLGLNADLAIACMEELGKRRSDGDPFDFEGYIEKEFNALPKINSSVPDLRTDLRTVLGQMITGLK